MSEARQSPVTAWLRRLFRPSPRLVAATASDSQPPALVGSLYTRGVDRAEYPNIYSDVIVRAFSPHDCYFLVAYQCFDGSWFDLERQTEAYGMRSAHLMTDDHRHDLLYLLPPHQRGMRRTLATLTMQTHLAASKAQLSAFVAVHGRHALASVEHTYHRSHPETGFFRFYESLPASYLFFIARNDTDLDFHFRSLTRRQLGTRLAGVTQRHKLALDTRELR